MLPYVITTPERLAAVADTLAAQPEWVFDLETTGPHRGVPAVNEVIWIALAWHRGLAVIPMGHPNGDHILTPAKQVSRRKDKETKQWYQVPARPAVWDAPPDQLDRDTVLEALAPAFAGPAVKIAHNSVFDICSLGKHIPVLPPYADSIVEAWLADENRRVGLKELTRQNYGLDYDTEQVGRCIEKHAFSTVARYAALDARMTWLNSRRARASLTAQRCEGVLAEETELLEALLPAARGGVVIDVPALEAMRVELHDVVADAEADVYKAAGGIFNLNSTQQKAKLLYGTDPVGEENIPGLGLTGYRLTKGGTAKKKASKPLGILDYSTDAEALELYKGNPVVDTILAYQEVVKIQGTYVDGYLGDPEAAKPKPRIIIDRPDGTARIYPTLCQYGTTTGRFSSFEPNLQNLPRGGSYWGTRIRDLILPDPGGRLLVADYGQIELRILAHHIGHGALFDGFLAGVDAHTATAALLFGVPWNEVTKAMRQVAKAINFAIIYGAGIPKVSSMAAVSTTEARKFMKKHRELFPEVYIWKEAVVRKARSAKPFPHIRTFSGRMRRLPDLLSASPELRSRAERQAVNAVCQGGNADIMKRAIVRLHRTAIPEMRMLVTVHDEIVATVPAQRAEAGAHILREAMVGDDMQILKVPLITDVVVCDRWSEAK